VSELSTFTTSAKSLSRNPLGIIALFIVLIYGFAALTLGFNSNLQPNERFPLVWFLVAFPVIVLCLFGWLVSKHHWKLYAPSDYRSDEIFFHRSEIAQRRAMEFRSEGKELEKKIRETVEELARANSEPQFIAERVAKEIEDATTFTVDASEFLGDDNAKFVYPVAAFDTLGNLTDDIYFQLSEKVRPYEYGSTWILRNEGNGDVIRTLRMLTGAPPGQPVIDVRSLREVGVSAGTSLRVERPRR
jgi:hypothetical protein